MRSAIAIGSALLVACGGTTHPRERICTPRAGDQSVFSSLTAHRWGACGAAVGVCVELDGNGNYSIIRGEGDYEVTSDGRWNFVARDDASGLVCLDDGSTIDFALLPDGLRWGLAGTLPPGDSLPISGAREGLPELESTDEMYAMTEHAWTKTNELDLYGIATELAFRRDGTFEASFRHGECTANGTFSLAVTQTGVELGPRVVPNTCDTRGGGTTANAAASNDHPVVDGGTLRLYSASYRDASTPAGSQGLSFTAYGEDSLRVEATWDGGLAAQPMTWRFSLHNASNRPQTLTSIRVTVTPVVATDAGFQAAGSEVIALDEMVNDVIAPGAARTSSESVSLTGAGLVLLDVRVSSFDDIQRYDHERSFIASL